MYCFISLVFISSSFIPRTWSLEVDNVVCNSPEMSDFFFASPLPPTDLSLFGPGSSWHDMLTLLQVGPSAVIA